MWSSSARNPGSNFMTREPKLQPIEQEIETIMNEKVAKIEQEEKQ